MYDNAINHIRSQQPTFLPKAKKKGWICPICKNGSGKDGDGIVVNPKSGGYKCFKCGFSGGIFDLIGVTYGLTEFRDQLKKASEIYGIDISERKNGRNPQLAIGAITHVAEKVSPKYVMEYIDKCHSRTGMTSYFAKRGITQESIDRFKLGFDPAYDEKNVGAHPWKAIIIPTSAETFEARNIDVEPNSSSNGRNKYRKHGNSMLFNGSVLQHEKERPIFICEGYIDAISIIQSGGEAIGLGSAVNYQVLITELEKVVPAKPLIIVFDDDNAGNDNAKKLSSYLDQRKIPYIIPDGFLGGFHDPNDRLMKDPAGLKEAIEKAYMVAASLPDPMDMAKDEYMKTSVGHSIPDFIDSIRSNAGRPTLNTGFWSIDNALDGGIYTGLYILGAISSLGKTTLALQIADNLAGQGHHVLFFSLEQSKYDLMAKSISRESYLYCLSKNISTNYAKTNLGISDGKRWANYMDIEKVVIDEAFNAYKQYANNLFIHEGIGNVSVSDIRERVKAHIAFTGNHRPIIFIDYLQILKAADGDERASDKQIVDHNVTALKQLSRDFDIPVIAVSSLNRQNYAEKINMAAFKESGAIEYGSDVLIGLQLTGAGERDFDVASAKEMDPRQIDFCILKNRNGRVLGHGIKMLFYSRFNCFIADDQNQQIKRNPSPQQNQATSGEKLDEKDAVQLNLFEQYSENADTARKIREYEDGPWM